MVTACSSATAPATEPGQSYVEPSLWTAESETLTVIVTAGDFAQAAELVERVGGQVVSDLWLIDAVSATMPADQLKSLAAQPGLVSIVADKQVKSAQEPAVGRLGHQLQRARALRRQPRCPANHRRHGLGAGQPHHHRCGGRHCPRQQV